LCDCGVQKVVIGANLKKSKTRSCGCIQKTHNKTLSTEYRSWQMMKNRCCNPKYANWNIYGGRGITVCDRWLNSFENFVADMGLKPTPKHSIDRIDGSGNYEPSNCRWANKKEQAENTSRNVFVKLNGETLTISDAARKIGIHQTKISWRLRNGWSLEKALSP
jgi:hypothetical protein